MVRTLLPAIILLVVFNFSFGQNVFSQQSQYYPLNDSIIAEYINEVNADSVESYIQFLEDMETRFMIAPNRKTVAESIKEKFLSLGVQDVRIDSFYSETVISYHNLQYDTLTTQYNVIATIPGMIDFEQFVVMGAHYDCVVAPEGDPMVFAPGADDNASGVAALFEVARILSLKEFLPEKSIELVAFGAEELMHYGYSGAHAYVDSAQANGIYLDMMINNDMIAYTASDEWKITISNYVGSEWLTTIAEQVTDTFTEIEPIVRGSSSNAGADCKYFYEAGVPCVYFMEDDFNPNYHSDYDLLDSCDLNYCSEAIKISLGVLLAIEDTTTTSTNFNEQMVIKVFPNPSSGQFKIETNNYSREINYWIYDLNGRLVEQGYLNEDGNLNVNISNLPGGIYSLVCGPGNQLVHEKIVLAKNN